MGDGVDIPLASMEKLNDALKNIILEFEDASKSGETLVNAIGRPLERTDLRDAADEFEGAWDDKRETLNGHLKSMQEQVEAVKTSWEDFDLDLAKQIDDAKNKG